MPTCEICGLESETPICADCIATAENLAQIDNEFIRLNRLKNQREQELLLNDGIFTDIQARIHDKLKAVRKKELKAGKPPKKRR